MSGFDFGSGGLPVPADIVVEGGFLVLYRSDGSRKVLAPAPSAGAPGAPGVGVSHTDIVGGNLVVTYTDGSTSTVGHVLGESGAPGVGIAAIEIVGGRLHVTLSNGNVLDLGQIVGSAGAAGRGITSSTIVSGHLVLTYTDGTQQDLGQATGATGAAGTNGRGISSTAIIGGRLILTYTDGTQQDAGPISASSGASSGGLETYVGTVEIRSSANPFDFAGSVPTSAKGNRATKVIVECVGGGASGYCAYSVPCHGGNPGQVTRRKLRVAEVPASIGAYVGAGGGYSNRTGDYAHGNSGGQTSFGALLAASGGQADDYFSLTDNQAGQGLVPGDVPSGRPGRANGSASNSIYQDTLCAAPSMGPGGGGASMTGGQSQDGGGRGGDSTVHLPNSQRFGGNGGNPGRGAAQAGQNAVDQWGYGAGGGGGCYATAPGGNGGYPGGGGGAGPGLGGAGGGGIIRLHFYVDE